MRYLIILGVAVNLIFSKIDTSQIVLVTTKNWNSSRGTMIFLEKKGGKWQKLFKSPVFVGRNGLAWGIGLHSKKSGNIKKEGDGRAPAGIFELSYAFGYQKVELNYPYKVMSRYDICIDDINSKYYNKIADSRKIAKDYNSFEKMKLEKNYYKLGLTVVHNNFNKTPAKGFGSCIFIHIKNKPTAGCTALPTEKSMLKLLTFLNKSKHPILIQGPKSEIDRLLKEASVKIKP